VNFTSFTITEHETNLLYRWSINGNKEVERFIIEFSDNGRTFQPIDTINANRNTDFMTYSKITKRSFESGTCFRIRALKQTGRDLYSKIICIENPIKSVVSLYPNPTSGPVQIKAPISRPTAEAHVIVNNSVGTMVYSSKPLLKDGKTNLDFSHLPPGIYFVSLEHEGAYFNYRFVKK